jgi:shikimate kinase
VLDPLICSRCGERTERPDVRGTLLLCGYCGHQRPFLRLPLFALTGPSAGGKSTIGPLLARALGDKVVVLEQDVLWTAGLRDHEDGHPRFRSAWLRLAAMIHQSGRPVVLCGTVVPPELEPRPERALFSAVHYLALTAEPDVLAARLRARPKWRAWDDEERIAEMLRFARWLSESAASLEPPVELVDTTHRPVAETLRIAREWVLARL